MIIATWEDLLDSPHRLRHEDVEPGASYRFLSCGPQKSDNQQHGIVHASNPGIPHSVCFPGHPYRAPRATTVHTRLGLYEQTEAPAGSWVIVAQWCQGANRGIPLLYLADYFGLGEDIAPKSICVAEASFALIKLTT